MNPVDKFLMTKNAGFMSNMGGALAEGAGTAVAAATVSGVGMAAMKAYDAITKQRDFKKMLFSPFNADLHEYHQSRPKEFNAAFSSLRTMNPEFSKDPMVAGLYMRRIMQYDPMTAAGALTESLQFRDKFPESPMEEVFHRGAVGGAQAGFTEGVKGQQAERMEGIRARGAKALESHKAELAGAGEKDKLRIQQENALRQAAFKAHLSGQPEPTPPGQRPPPFGAASSQGKMDPRLLRALQNPQFR